MTAWPILEFCGEHRFLSNFWVEMPLAVDLNAMLGMPYMHVPMGVPGSPGIRAGVFSGLSVEHIYQAAKVGPEDDALLADDMLDKMFAIVSASDGKYAGCATAKRLGGLVTPLRHGWDQGLKQRVMLACLRRKFSVEHNPENVEMLRATGCRMLVEGNRHGDTTWGAIWMGLPAAKESGLPIWARDADPATRPLVKALAGNNWLGRLLMLVRAELDCAEAIETSERGA